MTGKLVELESSRGLSKRDHLTRLDVEDDFIKHLSSFLLPVSIIVFTSEQKDMLSM
jgi:hypothetical protein